MIHVVQLPTDCAFVKYHLNQSHFVVRHGMDMIFGCEVHESTEGALVFI